MEARTSQLAVSCCATEIRDYEKTQKNDKAKNDDQRYAILSVRYKGAVIRGAIHDQGR